MIIIIGYGMTSGGKVAARQFRTEKEEAHYEI
jgi:hypothetical protein